MSSEGLPLPVLFRRSLETSSKAYPLPTIQKETQELLKAAVSDLRRVSYGIGSLALFSSNETLEDLATGDIVYLLVPYVLSDVQSRLSIEDEYEREEVIVQCQRLLKQFTDMIEAYSIVSDDEATLARKNRGSLNAAARRELKINQYQKEKDLKAKIQSMQKDRKRGTSENADEFSLISSLLKVPSDNGEEEDDENLRALSLMVLRLYYAQHLNNSEVWTRKCSSFG